VFAIASRDCVE